MSGIILLTGATGYVGGRLLRVLHRRGKSVRCLTRHPERLAQRVPEGVEVAQGDVLKRETLAAALDGVEAAYYFVHSMGSAEDFEETDRTAAENFAEAAAAAGVKRIIYLGGLGDEDAELSPHLRSRQEVGRILGSTGVPVIEFRASIVLGSGSLSFEMIRALVEKLPVMITPRWVDVPAQPIAIDDLLQYLVAALDLPEGDSRVYEIGGDDQVSYGELMNEYARQRGLRRAFVRVPVLTPRLSSLWLGLVTPLYARIGRKLIDSIRHPTLVRDTSAQQDFDVRPVGYSEAISAALRNEDREMAETRWSDALSSGGDQQTWAGVKFGNRLVDSRTAASKSAPADAFTPIRRLGGPAGWLYADDLWRLRGLLDLALGGVGLRRGRRHPDKLHVGDAVDCWRVEAIEPDRRLRLFAEMRLPGRAWLEFEVEPKPAGSQVRQTAIFDPVGLRGLAYWYLVYPLHQIVFRGMLRQVVAAGEQGGKPSAPHRPSPTKQAAWLAAFVGVCLAAGGLGGALTSSSVTTWYQSLDKPAWTPPDWLFGPVWTALYVLMGIAAWLVWRRDGWAAAKGPLTLFGVQLALNVAWSGIFFGLQMPGAAFAEIVALWLAIAATTFVFWNRSALAGALLTPYLAWTTFAAALNLAIWQMNA